PAGDALAVHAAVVLQAMDAAVDAVAAVRSGTGGRLRIGSFATADAVLVPAIVADLRRELPELTTTVTEGLTRDLVAGLRAGALDVAVVSDYPDGGVDDAGLVLEHLCDDELLVALPAGHRLAGEAAVDLADLAGESWIEAGRLAIDNAAVNLLAARAGFVPRTDITVPGWTAKQGFVAAGLGVTLVPRLAAPAMRHDIVLRPVRDPMARRRVHLARPAGRLGEVTPVATDHFLRLARAAVTRIL
ncbi:MAG TPA: LysR substrate-binding domain-containing protein, partial [Acidimicrobiales bacterium]|nr:LysR substrate-binding domain-containing protein [Acidimicrobiales bacterium]